MTSLKRSKLSRLCQLAVAAGLAWAANASFAGAIVNVTSFTVSAQGLVVDPGDPANGIPPTYATAYGVANNPFVDIQVSGLTAGGLGGAAANSYTANAWQDAANVSAITPKAQATGIPGVFTDPSTQLGIGIFQLSASTQGSFFSAFALPSTASANANQTGEFSLIDANGDAAAGRLTFDIFYDLSVASPMGGPFNQATAGLDFSVSTDEGGLLGLFSDLIMSTDFGTGIGNVESGHFMFSLDLAANEIAYFALSGNAYSASTAISEPGALLMVSTALAGLALTRRRKIVSKAPTSAAAA